MVLLSYLISIFFPSPFPVHRRILLHFVGRCRAALGCRSSLMNQREGFVSPGSPREAMLYAPNHPRCFISFPSLLYIFTLISYLRRYFSNTLAHPKPTQQELSGQVTVKDVIVELNGTAGEGAPCTAPFFFHCYCLNGSKTVKHCFCTHTFFLGGKLRIRYFMYAPLHF